MTGLVKTVRSKVDPRCLVNCKMGKDGCKISMAGAPNDNLIVDFDKLGSPFGPNETRCDYLFIADGKKNNPGWVVPLELKRGGLKAGEVVKQLRAGACAAERLVTRNEVVIFRPVAASGSRHKAVISKLKKRCNYIRFHGHAEPIRLIPCGAPLTNVL